MSETTVKHPPHLRVGPLEVVWCGRPWFWDFDKTLSQVGRRRWRCWLLGPLSVRWHVGMADEMILLRVAGHHLRPAWFWWDTETIEGLQCRLCCRVFPTGQDAGEHPCDVFDDEQDFDSGDFDAPCDFCDAGWVDDPMGLGGPTVCHHCGGAG